MSAGNIALFRGQKYSSDSEVSGCVLDDRGSIPYGGRIFLITTTSRQGMRFSCVTDMEFAMSSDKIQIVKI
jgi:hypothetical protein